MLLKRGNIFLKYFNIMFFYNLAIWILCSDPAIKFGLNKLFYIFEFNSHFSFLLFYKKSKKYCYVNVVSLIKSNYLDIEILCDLFGDQNFETIKLHHCSMTTKLVNIFLIPFVDFFRLIVEWHKNEPFRSLNSFLIFA